MALTQTGVSVITGYTGFTNNSTSSSWNYTQQTRTVSLWLDYGALNPQVKYAALSSTTPQSLVVLLENMPDTLAAIVPKNLEYYDPTFCYNNYAVYYALGQQVIPIIANNSVETNSGIGTVLSGAGGAGAYEHVITTSLTNAVLSLVPINGTIT